MAKRVFHPPEAERWPTKEANTFMAKNLTLVPEQKMELESDLNQEAFLKDFEKNPSYKQAFDFKTKDVRFYEVSKNFFSSVFQAHGPSCSGQTASG